MLKILLPSGSRVAFTTFPYSLDVMFLAPFPFLFL